MNKKSHYNKNAAFSKTAKLLFAYVLPPLFVAAIVITAIWGSTNKARAEEYQTAAEGYRRSNFTLYERYFSELADTVYDMEVALSKMMVVNSPAQYVLTLEDITRASGTCVAILSQIPQSHVDTHELNGFLVRIGDYSRYLSKSVLAGKPLSQSDMEQLSSLYSACMELTTQVRQRVDSGDFPVEGIDSNGYYDESQANEGESAENDANTETKPQYPTLIYDGPFSESAEKATPQGLTGEVVDEASALEIAEKYAGCPMQLSGYSGGDIPAFDFEGVCADERRVDVSVTVQGGHILWYMVSGTPTEAQATDMPESNGTEDSDQNTLPDEAAYKSYVEACVGWLSSQGYSDMRPTYAQYYDGTALISFAWSFNDIIVYNDLIKVWLDRETLQPVGMDSRNYLYSHIERQIEAPLLTQEEAEGYVSPNLSIESRLIALIPVSPSLEALCYEFRGRLGEDEYIVYINAATGAEEQIFRVINDENGQSAV